MRTYRMSKRHLSLRPFSQQALAQVIVCEILLFLSQAPRPASDVSGSSPIGFIILNFFVRFAKSPSGGNFQGGADDFSLACKD
mmetsp:Transcript_13083/g.22624  ORF Transcript_13083/g.22624 Transcript_13083/m.22624 type:complete len:83 (-) Transcript_13083:519-767(-)